MEFIVYLKSVLVGIVEGITEGLPVSSTGHMILFDEFVKLDGIILTKLDGTAKGGVVIAIEKEYQLPVAYIGVGEGVDDLEEFDYNDFIDNLL